MRRCFNGCANTCWRMAWWNPEIVKGKEDAGAKFADYFDSSETISTIPSHRALAMFRGRREEILHVDLRLDSEAEKPKWDAPHNPCEARMAAHFGIRNQEPPGRRMAERYRALDLAGEKFSRIWKPS